jgi:hypothetical protein
MATIRKLKSGRYNVQVRREGHPPLSATFPNTTEAKAWARADASPAATSASASTWRYGAVSSGTVTSARRPIAAARFGNASRAPTMIWRALAVEGVHRAGAVAHVHK